MINIEEVIKELTENYNVSYDFINDIYRRLLEIPLINENDERIVECLELIAQDESDKNNSYEAKKDDIITLGLPKSLDYSINDALYRVYEEEAEPYLSEEYLAEKINIDDDNYGIER